MTVTTNTLGYLEDPYLGGAYLTPTNVASMGMQANFTIADFPDEVGMQAIAGTTAEVGMQVKTDTLAHAECGGYLTTPYLEGPYLNTRVFCASMGMQVKAFIEDFEDSNGMQAELQVTGFEDDNGMQTEFTIVDFPDEVGMQFLAVVTSEIGMQFLATLYNTTNLRILCDFPSRGTPAQSGTNWSTNDQASGDFDINNINTDIVDQVYRSTSPTGVEMDCDVGLAQGVSIDTLAILNHNLSRAATVQIFGSDDPAFGTIGVTITPTVRDENIFWILPTVDFPLESFRYWRIAIDDATNADGYVEVGTVVFGASEVFQGECLVDQIQTQKKDFADTISTEGFTNVANSRALRRAVAFDFRSLDFNKRNFEVIQGIFCDQRTILKCLWIPTPSDTNVEALARFAVFSKLAGIPVETHNSKGPDADYVSFTVELDESL